MRVVLYGRKRVCTKAFRVCTKAFRVCTKAFRVCTKAFRVCAKSGMASLCWPHFLARDSI